MSEKKVSVTIRSVRELDGERESYDTAARGTLRREGETLVLTYFPQGGRATLRVHPGCVVLERQGEIASKMVFREGRRCVGDYVTPYGAMAMAVTATGVDNALSDDGGELLLEYELELSGGSLGRHSVRIEVQSKE